MPIDITRKMQGRSSHRRSGNEGSGIFHWLLRAPIKQWQRRKMIAALEALDDWVLRDIGIHREDIPRLVDEFDDRELRMTPLASAEAPIWSQHEAYHKSG